MVRNDTEGYQFSLLGRLQTGGDGGCENLRSADRVIRRRQQHDGIRIVAQENQRRQGGRRGGVAAARL